MSSPFRLCEPVGSQRRRLAALLVEGRDVRVEALFGTLHHAWSVELLATSPASEKLLRDGIGGRVVEDDLAHRAARSETRPSGVAGRLPDRLRNRSVGQLRAVEAEEGPVSLPIRQS